MKKITIALLLLLSPVLAWSQLSCDGAVQLTDGYTEMGITTPGTGSGPGSWVTSATLCGTAGQYHHNCFTSVGDDYVFSYTTGATAGETVAFTIRTNINYIGLLAFTGCNGTVFNGCVDWKYAPTQNTTMTVTASNLPANQTVYFGVGIWSTPNNLAFDVMSFTVTHPTGSTQEQGKNGFSVFPNPVNDILKLSYSSPIETVEVYNMLGQQVMRKEFNENEVMLDVQQLPAGNYTVKAKSGGAVTTEKIVKI